MFEAFKKLFSRQAGTPPPAPIAPAPPTAAPAPSPRSAAPSATPAPAAHAPVPLLTGDLIHLPLNDILSRLPPSIAGLALSRPGGTFSLPLKTALEQLHAGIVRIPFAQLRQGAPPGTFTPNTSFDDALIDLPLAPILAAIGLSALSRRANQTRIDVPDSITGVFAPKGSPPIAPPPAPPAAPPTPSPLKMMPEAPKSPPPTPPQPVPIKPTTSIAQAPAAPKPTAPAPLPFAAAKSSAPLPFVTTRPVPATPPAPAAPTPALSADDTIILTVESVSTAWADAIRQEIIDLDLTAASVSIPLSRLEAGMKTGRVVFTWIEIRSWMSPPVFAPTHLGGTSLELPLKLLAPLFIASRRPAAPQKKVTVGDNIPDLFAGLTKPSAAAPAPSAPVAPPTPAAPTPVTAAPVAPDAMGEIFGQPWKSDWTAQEIVQRIGTLDGVAATLIATSDGFLVAGQVPAPWKADTLAGFLPQMFNRMAHYTSEAELGTLHSLTLYAGQAPWAIFTAGPLFLAVLGQLGHPLPAAALQRIAGELAKRNP